METAKPKTQCGHFHIVEGKSDNVGGSEMQHAVQQQCGLLITPHEQLQSTEGQRTSL
jgi:hypothetical protein